MLYVQDDNIPALRLYKSFDFHEEEVTYQYELEVANLENIQTQLKQFPLEVSPINKIPASHMPLLTSQWTDIASMHNPPHQYVLIFHDVEGTSIGYCRLTPGFPGCFPFIVAHPENYLLNALKALKPYLLPEKVNLKLTIVDPKLAKVCAGYQFRLKYKLYKMVRTKMK